VVGSSVVRGWLVLAAGYFVNFERVGFDHFVHFEDFDHSEWLLDLFVDFLVFSGGHLLEQDQLGRVELELEPEGCEWERVERDQGVGLGRVERERVERDQGVGLGRVEQGHVEQDQGVGLERVEGLERYLGFVGIDHYFGQLESSFFDNHLDVCFVEGELVEGLVEFGSCPIPFFHLVEVEPWLVAEVPSCF